MKICGFDLRVRLDVGWGVAFGKRGMNINKEC